MKIPGRVRRVEITGRAEAEPGDQNTFLSLHRLRVVNVYDDASKSPEYTYDGVLRKWLDAVVLLLTAEVDGKLSVCLRSCIRPPVLLRKGCRLPVPDEGTFDTLWELPAGLIEDSDRGASGIVQRAATEALEETGYELAAEDFELLPGAPFVSPGVIPERLHFVRACVRDISERTTPQGDGSPAEDGGGIWWLDLDEGLHRCERGEIIDVKTELGLRRLVAIRSRDRECLK